MFKATYKVKGVPREYGTVASGRLNAVIMILVRNHGADEIKIEKVVKADEKD